MEKLRRVVNEIAYAENPRKLSPLHRSLLPFLSIASALYKLALSLRHSIYRHRFFQIHRLPVPVISVGNLTWGGNGKTPMVEFIALCFARSGISPLLLSRGYGGGDEVNMLRRHLLGTPNKFGVGPNRASVANQFIQKYGYIDIRKSSWYEKQNRDGKVQNSLDSEKIGVVVLDDAMQMGALYVDRIDFSDHHILHSRDIDMIRARLGELEGKFGSKPIVVITEKDYDRDPEILKQLFPFKVYVLCSTLKVLPYRGSMEDSFKKFLKDQLKLELPPPMCY